MKRVLLIATFVLCWTQVSAETLYVPSEQYSTIQSAIIAADTSDTVIVGPNTYYENIDFLGRAITVRSVDPNDPNVVAATIIDGSNPVDPNIGSVVTFKNGEDANSVLSGFTITGGTGSWLPISWHLHEIYWNRCGGGVFCYNMSAPTITKNVFINNTAGQGGGIYIYGNHVDPNNPSNPPVHISPVITDNTFTNNTASSAHGFPPPDDNYLNGDHGDGGAIVGFQGVDAIIKENIIENNHADYYGGGIHLRQWSNGEISENQILNNDSTLGAGIHITYTSSPHVAHNLIKSNATVGAGGGGIYVYYYSDPIIEHNFIAQNYSWQCAGIAVYWSSEPQIRNNILVENMGLAILCNTGGTTIVTGNTISDNYENFNSGGIRCRGSSTPIIEHNIITSNEGKFGIYADAESTPTIRYNNVWDNENGNYGPVIGDQTGINGNISVAPNFIAPDSNDYHLNYNSKCINAGDPNFIAEEPNDFDGQPRIMGQFVDIGADEACPVWNITSGEQYDNIQAAIDDANDANVIVVTVGTHTGPGNKNIDFAGKDITLRSVNPNDSDVVAATIIDCQSSGRGFRFHTVEDANSVVDGLTITNGSPIFDGGAIHCQGSSPTIRNCIITNNSTRGHGGGIYCGYNSNPIISNCIISSNTFFPDGYGGGIYCYKSSPTIINCIITDNSAVGQSQHGGGICCWGDQEAGGDALVVNSIISGNSAGQRGGGLYAYWSSPIFVNCTVIGNTAAEGGGIGSFRESNPAVINCIVRDNIAPDGNQFALINTSRVWEGTNIPTEMTVLFSDIEGGWEEACVDHDCTLYWDDNSNIDIDPNFVDQGYWDDANTPTDPNDDFFVAGNYHLTPGSACIDAGDNLSVPFVSTTDIDGEQRIFNDTVDIGADEVVTNPADFNTDGIVDFLDISTLIDEWLTGGSQLKSDLYDDDFIDFADYALFAGQWLWKGGWYE